MTDYRTPSYAENDFDCYFFEKNLQGDIVAIYNESGVKVGTYTYDAWGNHTATPVSTATALERLVVTKYNPFRYRGYYYDNETGYYYLQSRYYNPTWGRFINADAYVSTGQGFIGYNMFAYCGNNPVIYADPSGELPFFIITMLVGAAIGFGITATVDYCDDGEIFNGTEKFVLGMWKTRNLWKLPINYYS